MLNKAFLFRQFPNLLSISLNDFQYRTLLGLIFFFEFLMPLSKYLIVLFVTVLKGSSILALR